MGLFTGLLTLPLAPVRGVVWIAEQLHDRADAQMNDPGVLRAKIDELDRAHERGEISESDRDEQQEELLERLMGRSRPVDDE
ncbi:gas vesicle protein GvpG [Pseudonocardia endophytica]|uniref:Gas vesicle protein GvpG n=1 Tax=Pseudonocardia endophytica TaxID=401976 RepID=A0A4R1HIG2_PSEEN|nr:gas vesicle protein GvpG [Pseudonocardia endophytica]TCK21588.1 gas vesicle protein GvpG [Pseudonocardia endophytica]